MKSHPYRRESEVLGNWEVLSQRCGQNFLCQREPIKETLLPNQEKKKKTHVLLHLTAEEDLSWLINAFYYME